MSGISRRRLLQGGVAAAGLSSVGVAAALAERHGLIPPDHGGLYGAGETLTYATQRLLMSRQSLARAARNAFAFKKMSGVTWRAMIGEGLGVGATPPCVQPRDFASEAHMYLPRTLICTPA